MHNQNLAMVLSGLRLSVTACLAALGGILGIMAAPSPVLGNTRAVYVQTNTDPENFVVVFNRDSDGHLTLATRVSTGGAGKPTGNPPLGIPFLDSAGSVTLSENGRLLFVVNAGDNTVSSFRVIPQGLVLADRESTFGTRPISATSHGNLLYVLNSDLSVASISGYYVAHDGQLEPIPGSVQPTVNSDNGIPAQVKFDADGDLIAVSERQTFVGGGFIDIFRLDKNGVPASSSAFPSADEGPFGIAFTHDNVMIVSNEHFEVPPETSPSTVSSYTLRENGVLALIGTQPANAAGACWNVITKNQKFVFVTSPFTSNINSFHIGRAGDLMPVNGTSVVGTGTGATLDLALSDDSQFLYVLDSPDFVTSFIDEFAVHHDGTITSIGTSDSFEGSASGMAAR